ncbi:GGDEF domain-containing protein [Aquabacterium sp.]|uniref:GGDEF domain-containing protein n=1 Tax=Aquabacterium sp. TaxID=1872578 RepID=UPI0035AFB177
MLFQFYRHLDRLIFGTEPKQRLRIYRSLMAANVYVICVGLQIYACWVGYMDERDVRTLSTVIVLNVGVWYILLRTGLSRLFRDPSLTLPQILAALTVIVGAYAVTGPVHGSTMMLLALVLVFGIFNLTARDARIAGSYTVVLMGLTMSIKLRSDPTHYPLKLEIAHFVLTAAIVPTISALAAQLSALRARLQAQKDELASAVTRIQMLATRDELTGLHNRRHMMEVLNQHQRRLDRSGHHRFCLALLDLDHFKRINDTHGHKVGDEVLRYFAEQARSVMREVDVLARWGGEEFLLLLVDTSPALAQIGIERIRAQLAHAPMQVDGHAIQVTFSAGLTGYWGTEPLDACIERADHALYRAKNEGRNRTVIDLGPGAELEPLACAAAAAEAPQVAML